MAEGRKLIRDEEKDSLTEDVVHHMDTFPQPKATDNNDH
jgi:HAE1 family hydrophobic/amphiphilic exporter-1